MDLRPTFRAALDAFGALPAVVTLPDLDPVTTEALWLPPVTVEVPAGNDFHRMELRRVLALSRTAVPQVPRGTVVIVAESAGEDPTAWQVDGIDSIHYDHTRALVVPA